MNGVGMRFVILGDGFPQLMKHLLALLIRGDGVEGTSCLRVIRQVYAVGRGCDPIHPFAGGGIGTIVTDIEIVVFDAFLVQDGTDALIHFRHIDIVIGGFVAIL